MNKQLLVSALENGTVIDHIPCERTNDVVTLLKLNNVSSTVMIGINLESKKMGHKTIIKVANKFFSDDELNKLSVIAPDVTLCIIRDYEVVEKKQVRMPEELQDIIRCANPKCICSVEPGLDHEVIQFPDGALRCAYCDARVEE